MMHSAEISVGIVAVNYARGFREFGMYIFFSCPGLTRMRNDEFFQ